MGIHDDFFALGGDSLQVAELVSRIDEELGRETQTPAFVLLRAPTVAELAVALREGEAPERVVRVGPERSAAPLFFFPTHEWETVGLGALDPPARAAADAPSLARPPSPAPVTILAGAD